MNFRILSFVGCVVTLCLTGVAQTQDQQLRFELANLRQDMMLLSQRVGEMAMNIEQLQRDNESLRSKSAQTYVTVEQLDRAVAELNRTLQDGLASQRREVLAQVSTQMANLGRQTNAALDSLAKSQATRPVVQTNFSDNFPKEGINYTVQAGDTLSTIAARNGSRVADIVNANKISDPTRIMVGQTLFIPQSR